MTRTALGRERARGRDRLVGAAVGDDDELVGADLVQLPEKPLDDRAQRRASVVARQDDREVERARLGERDDPRRRGDRGRQRQIEAAASYWRNATTAATIAVATATCSAVSWKAPIAAASATTPPRQIRYARDAIAMWK